jgi:hypothetical protein
MQASSYGLAAVAFVIGRAIMANGGIVEILLGVPAERKPLEAVARPIDAMRRRVGTRCAATPALGR